MDKVVTHNFHIQSFHEDIDTKITTTRSICMHIHVMSYNSVLIYEYVTDLCMDAIHVYVCIHYALYPESQLV